MTIGLIEPFFLTLAVSFLIGIGLREYYEGEKKFDTFGTVRTFVFVGMLGFVLFELPEIGRAAYLGGMAALGVFLALYYANKLQEKKSPGLIGVLIALLTYAIGPITLTLPAWFPPSSGRSSVPASNVPTPAPSRHCGSRRRSSTRPRTRSA